jgi:hypothetical protein
MVYTTHQNGDLGDGLWCFTYIILHFHIDVDTDTSWWAQGVQVYMLMQVPVVGQTAATSAGAANGSSGSIHEGGLW